MAFSFQIAKPQDVKGRLKSTERDIINGGGSFAGDEKSGSFSGGGVSGTYTVEASSVKIVITKKPLLYPEAVVRSKITEYFSD